MVAVNENGSVESEPATLKVLRPATILRHTESQNLKLGAEAKFAVAAVGRGNLTYQWTFNGSPIPLETAHSLVLPNIQGANTGLYAVRVSDSIGAAFIQPVQLNALVRPTFIVQPQSRVLIAGDSLELRVEVDGLKPLAYRWRKGAAPISAAQRTPF